jgi:predicted transcriptional regulator
MAKFQLLPLLSAEERIRLEISIKDKGTCSIEVDENGDILDGHHRYEICQKLDIVPEKIQVNNFKNDLEKMAYVIKINSARRQMSGDQEKEVDKERQRIAKDLYAIGEYTQENISNLLGVTQQAVSLWLNSKPDNVSGTSACTAYIIRKRVGQKIGKEEKEAILEQLDSGLTHEKVAANFKVARPRITQIKRNAEKKKIKAEERAAELSINQDNIWLGDIRDLGQKISDNSIDFIFTDPPYGKKVIEDYEELAKFAARTLKPGASLLVYSGQSVLPEVYAIMCQHLNYWWTMCMEHGGQNQRLPGKFVYVEWKPIIWFVKGNRRDSHFVSDLVKSKQDKDHHEWGQGVEEASYYIEQLTQLGELVCDPFLGGGTTGIAAQRLNRKFLGFEKDPEVYRKVINGNLS